MDSKWSLHAHLAQTVTTCLFSAPLASAVPDGNKRVGDLSHRGDGAGCHAGPRHPPVDRRQRVGDFPRRKSDPALRQWVLRRNGSAVHPDRGRRCRPRPAGLSGAGPNRELRIEVRHADHSDTNPQPMNPRELLYLLSGNDSTVATTHPLLLAMDASAPPSQRIRSR